MRIKELSAWHRFTYTQLYPNVLGSMLYDVLHVTQGWGPLQVIEISDHGPPTMWYASYVFGLSPRVFVVEKR